MSIETRLRKLEQATPSDELAQQVMQVWREIGIDLDAAMADKIADVYRRKGFTECRLETLIIVSRADMLEL